jgi:glycosyltransferase involved in cell wall biosynthesis
VRNPIKTQAQYVVVTPAKNEEALIGTTIQCVVDQTIRPVEWVIVSDGSTDGTDAIVSAAAALHPWIHLVALPPRADRNFAAVVRATEAGVRVLTIQDYDYIGLLDSDLRFAPDYFEKVIEQFEMVPQLGLAGGVVVDPGQDRKNLPRNREDIPGATQFFRRRCYEELGGLLAIPEGGWDALTCVRARMLGYQTRLLTDLIVDHLKPRNVSEGGAIRRLWQMGVRDYALGYHPVFEGFKCASRIVDSPVIVGASAWWVGYCSALLQRRRRHIPEDLLEFVRLEQRIRLRRLVGLRGK